MKIRVITPSTMKVKVTMALDQYSAAAAPDTELSATVLDRGPASVDSLYEEAMAVADTVAKIVQAEKDGMDGVISNCMLDPGVEAGRQMVSIPVIGPAEASMHVAAMLGHKFSVVTILDSLIPAFDDHAVKLGLTSQLASVRAVNMRGVELDDHASVASAVIDQSVRAVREDGAHVIVLGCTAMRSLAKDVEEGLRAQGIADVPVIDPAILALKIAEALADMGLSQSKRTYPNPPEQEIIKY